MYVVTASSVFTTNRAEQICTMLLIRHKTAGSSNQLINIGYMYMLLDINNLRYLM